MRNKRFLNHAFLQDLARMTLLFAFLSFVFFVHWGMTSPGYRVEGVLYGSVSFIVLSIAAYVVYSIADVEAKKRI